jgi:hypothetical protein
MDRSHPRNRSLVEAAKTKLPLRCIHINFFLVNEEIFCDGYESFSMIDFEDMFRSKPLQKDKEL